MSAGFRCSVVTSPSGAERLAVGQRQPVPAGPRSPSRTQPLMFWPRSTTCTPGRTAGHRDRTDLLDRPAPAGLGERRGRRSRGRRPRRRPSRRRRSPARPSRRRPAGGPRPAPRSGRPRGRAIACCASPAGPDDGGAPVGVLDVQLGEQGRAARPTGRRRAAMPTWPRYHPSASTAPSAFAPG